MKARKEAFPPGVMGKWLRLRCKRRRVTHLASYRTAWKLHFMGCALKWATHRLCESEDMKIGIFVCVTVVMVLKKQATNELEKNKRL